MIIANMAKTCSILRLRVEGSGLRDGVGVSVGVGVGVDVSVGVGVIVGDGVRIGSFTVTNESKVVCSMGNDVLGYLG